MSVVTLTINDQMVTAQSGQSLLEVIREQGIQLPTLCHLDGLSERGGCRLCLVEVQGVARPVAACVGMVQEGQVVQTDTERLIRYRQMTTELLLAERNHVCSVCVMNGHCDLQTTAATVGVDHVRFDYLHPTIGVDASHERFVFDANRCILCTRCVRVCDEVEGAHTWDVSGRGVNSRVISDLNQPWGSSTTCTSCGKCVQVCPTGALYRKGATVAEMQKDRGFLPWILAGRTRKQGNR
jgi:bidirectional [NiFe] hydrogenase diaphorase subunit